MGRRADVSLSTWRRAGSEPRLGTVLGDDQRPEFKSLQENKQTND